MEVIESTLRYIENKESQHRQMNHISALCQLQLPISQNRPVRLFVGVHHVCP